jgi:hypothetical protein
VPTIHFQALKNFFSKEFESDYCEGLTYRARPEDKLLRTLIPSWLEAGKIKIIDAANKSSLTGA